MLGASYNDKAGEFGGCGPMLLRTGYVASSAAFPVADPGGGAPLFLDQTKARRTERNYLGDRAPPYLRVWIRN